MWTGRATARAGLAGNPSDGYGGAVVAVPVPSFAAEVELIDADEVRLHPPELELRWRDLGELRASVGRTGHEGSVRLVTSAIEQLAPWAPADAGAFELRWRTTIPRSVGLAGSSALVIATLRALSARWGVALEPRVLAAVALQAERALGLHAGMQDRVVQSFGCPVLMDFGEGSTEVIEGWAVPCVRPVRPSPGLSLFVAWTERAASPSSRYQAELRRRWEAGEREVVVALEELATLAREAAAAVEGGDVAGLSEVLDACATRRRRLGPQPPEHEALMAAAVGLGLSATSAGSGGSIVGVLPSPSALEELRAELVPLAAQVVGVDLAEEAQA